MSVTPVVKAVGSLAAGQRGQQRLHRAGRRRRTSYPRGRLEPPPRRSGGAARSPRPAPARVSASALDVLRRARARRRWPAVMMSPGPCGQSKLTTARPAAIASTITMPKPSKRELRTNIEALAISSRQSPAAAHQCHPVAEPERVDLRLQPLALRPAAVDPQLPVGCRRATSANAAISRSKPFWRVEPPGGHHDGSACVGDRPVARRHRVGDPLDARRAPASSAR